MTPTNSPTVVSCPVSNGTIYDAQTVPNAEFSLECGVDYQDNNIDFPEGYKISKRAPIAGVSFIDCVEFCARLCDCVSISYSFSTNTCQPKSALGDKVEASTANDIINARRIQPGCISSSSSSAGPTSAGPVISSTSSSSGTGSAQSTTARPPSVTTGGSSLTTNTLSDGGQVTVTTTQVLTTTLTLSNGGTTIITTQITTVCFTGSVVSSSTYWTTSTPPSSPTTSPNSSTATPTALPESFCNTNPITKIIPVWPSQTLMTASSVPSSTGPSMGKRENTLRADGI
ncbi:uncharacterized protein BKCO1_15000148 [Diplodia corticola]|uniref:Apple domain-containing protein n=1 Tax=Diplodia corticola TaxID=236234 RepID=A0A1J9R2S8_9PEZI|nr:uncharacterized protein BKCO1_15000148 [Diplodia corticola]OJD35710.1 hypothetical protein BKCO1_15000148 [Diplodia corticola]